MEYYGETLTDALSKATGSEKKMGDNPGVFNARFQVYAPPAGLGWGPWQEITALIGGHPSKTRTYTVSFGTNSQAESTFDVEIKGGDQIVRSIGPGSAKVQVTGNVATAISIRAKSHLVSQNVVGSLR